MISEEVLIIGGGFAGLTTAAALAESGVACTVIDSGGDFGGRQAQLDRLYQTAGRPQELVADLLGKLESSGSVKLLRETKLTECSGVAGDFECRLQSGGSAKSKRFGAIVLATGSIVKTPGGLPGLDKLGQVPEGAQRVCVILAPGGASSVVQTEAALDGARTLRDRGIEVTVLYEQMRVAGAGLQSLYDEARDSGVVFGRYAGAPAVTRPNGAFEVEFTADDLAERIRLHCDAVLAEGEELPSPGAQELAAMVDIDVDSAGFFQKENVSLYPVGTRRRGIFAVGSCRKPVVLDEVVSDSRCAAGQIEEMFAILRDGPPVDAPTVDTEKCAFCLTCYRACPHRAIGFDFENRAAKILENACFACGICVVECPARAIKFETAPEPVRAKIVGFFCRHSASETLKKLKEKALDVPEIAVTEVACSGTVEIPDILEAFEQGADGVVVAGCHKGSCRSLTGSHYAQKRSERDTTILEHLGLEPERLEMLFVSDVEPNELARALRVFGQRLEQTRKGE